MSDIISDRKLLPDIIENAAPGAHIKVSTNALAGLGAQAAKRLGRPDIVFEVVVSFL